MTQTDFVTKTHRHRAKRYNVISYIEMIGTDFVTKTPRHRSNNQTDPGGRADRSSLLVSCLFSDLLC